MTLGWVLWCVCYIIGIAGRFLDDLVEKLELEFYCLPGNLKLSNELKTL